MIIPEPVANARILLFNSPWTASSLPATAADDRPLGSGIQAGKRASIFLQRTRRSETAGLGECVGLAEHSRARGTERLFRGRGVRPGAVRRTRVEELVSQKVPGARSVARSLAQIDRTIATTQWESRLTSLGLGAVSETVLAQALKTSLTSLAGRPYLATSVASWLSCSSLTCTWCSANYFPSRWPCSAGSRRALGRRAARGLRRDRQADHLFSSTAAADSPCSVRLQSRRWESTWSIPCEELALVIEDTEQAGLLDAEQAELVQNVFRLSNKNVKDCMIPREKMAALELHTLAGKDSGGRAGRGAHTHAGLR